jgi:hypothetical protein
MCNQEERKIRDLKILTMLMSRQIPLILFHCSGKEGRLQELYKFPESAPTSRLQLLST